MNRVGQYSWQIAVCLFFLSCIQLSADTHTWDDEAKNGLWSTAVNWSPDGVPIADDVVVFDGTSVSNCTADAVSNSLASITLNAAYTGTVTFLQGFVNNSSSNELTLTGDLTVNGGRILCQGGTNGTPADGTGITVNAQNITVGAAGWISANGQGFSASNGPGTGMSGGSSGGAGGSYGGRGGEANGGQICGPTYGSATAPTSLGSGGGNVSGLGSGGGAIKLVASAIVTVNGTVSANGSNGAADNNAGGGSGGSLWIICNTFAGSGTNSADGGNPSGGGGSVGGGGGGGRIRISYTTSTFSGTVSARGGNASSGGGLKGYPGTYSFPDNQDLTVKADFALAPGTYNIPILIVTNNSMLGCQGDTNGTYGTGVVVNATTTTVVGGSSISAVGQGFGSAAGPGAGINGGSSGGGGASHGGRGGDSNGGYLPGATYGSHTNPTALGSGGGNTNTTTSGGGGWGGGAIKLVVSDTLTVNGTISANGTNGVSNASGGGGSGGSLWIICGTFAGSGTNSADGGNPSGGGGNVGAGGGGGRIRISYTTSTFSGTVSARGGNASSGGGARGSPGTYSFPDNQDLMVKADFALAPGTYNIPILIVTNNAMLGCQGDTNGTYGTGVVINATTTTVVGGSSISAVGQGFGSAAGPGAGINGGSSGGGGASYGGRGGDSNGSYLPGATYGSHTNPTALGSGGGNTNTATKGGGGWGGGAIKLVVSDTLTVNGTISANGTNGASNASGGGGSGGSLWMICNTFAGGGTNSADGGNPSGGGSTVGAGGGGGRIRISYTTSTFSGTVSARGGNASSGGGRKGYPGTYSFPDNQDLTVKADFALAPGTYNIPILIVTNNSMLGCQGDTNGTYGTGVVINATTTTVVGGSSISAVGQGFGASAGPGAGMYGGTSGGGGGGYGGRGGDAEGGYLPGPTYGSHTNPTALGSGGGNTNTATKGGGGWGGGAIKLVVTDTLTVNGTISACGTNSTPGVNGGGGSGGSVWIICNTLAGSGTNSADGGTADSKGGGGGGGRIKISYTNSTFSGVVSAKSGNPGSGSGTRGYPGTYSFPDGTNMTINADVALVPGTYNIPTLLVTNNAILSLQGDTNSTYGTGVKVNATNITVASGAMISAIGQGFGASSGPGKGADGGNNGGGGGGYGGTGGTGSGGALGGVTYGSDASPTALGSGGGNVNGTLLGGGGWAGGAIRLIVPGTFTVDGIVSAQGTNGVMNGSGGGGSGGSIWASVGVLAGSGILTVGGGKGAAGNNAKGGGGGGGRIRIDCNTATLDTNNNVIATGGAHSGSGGADGATGVVVCMSIPSGAPMIENETVTNIASTSALLVGNLYSTGSAPTEVFAYYGTNNGGADKSAWSFTNYLGTNAEGLVTGNATGLVSETKYYYRFVASNTYGETWAYSSATFTTVRTPFDAGSWPHRMKITFSGYDKPETLVNFPALVILNTNLSNFSYASFASTNGWDLRFSDSSQTVELNYEVEKWSTNTNSYVWVQVPSISSSNDYIWAYWGNPGQTSAPPVYTTNGMTWDSTYLGVYHLNESGAITNAIDSTSNAYHGVETGNITSTNAVIAGGRGMTGSQTFPVSSALSLSNKAFTITTWINRAGGSGENYWAGGGSSATDKGLHCGFVSSSGMRFGLYSDDANNSADYSGDRGDWHFYAFVMDTSHYKNIYRDGVRLPVTGSSNDFYKSAGFVLGAKYSGTASFNGQMDEMEVSGGIARSSNWIWACWFNTASNSFFSTYAVQEPAGSVFIFQ